MNFEMRLGFPGWGQSAPVRHGPASTWSKLGELVEETTSAPSAAHARAVVAAWLEKNVGTAATFIGRLEEGEAASYTRHTPAFVVERLFANGPRYANDVERFTADIVTQRSAVAYVLDDIASRPLVDEILRETHSTVGVFTAVDIGKRPMLRAFFGHERVFAEDRAVITASMRILAMAELAHDAPSFDLVDRAPRAKRRCDLTEREREVLEYLALGYTNPEIAVACGNAPNTVKKQIAAIFGKLGASTRAEAVRIAIVEGHVMRNR